jgi:restriction system protein
MEGRPRNTGDGASSPPVWVVRAGKGGRYADRFEELGLIAIGFEEIGNVAGLDRDSLFEHARQQIGSRAGNVAGQVYRFANQMKPGDLVAVPDGGTRELLYGRVSGDYEHWPEPAIAHYRHVRKVEWLGRRNRDALPDRVLFSLGSLLTVFGPSSQGLLAGFLLTGEVAPDPDLADDGPAQAGDEGASLTSAGEQEARNKELIGKQISQLGWEETQDLAAGVLRALGYRTQVADAGADGGVDIRACRDPLFLHPPIVKVQVKARPAKKTSPDEIRQLNGLVDRTGERGIFVATGGFTDPAEKEAAQMGVQLWDLECLVDLFLEAYDELDERIQGFVALRQIWVLDDPKLGLG